MLPVWHLAEESVVGGVLNPHAVILGHQPVRLDAVLQTVELPARIANLHACLPDVKADAFPLK